MVLSSLRVLAHLKSNACYCLLLLVVFLPFCPTANGTSETSAAVHTTRVREQNFSRSFTAYGRLDSTPNSNEVISLPRGGIITRLWVITGQRVRKGDPLFEFQTDPDAVKQYQQAKAAYAVAQQEYRRQQQLLSEHLTAQATFQNARQAMEDTRASLLAAEKNGQSVETEIFTAKTDAVVLQTSVSEGDRVPATSVALTLAPAQHWIARLNVLPEDASSLTEDSRIQVLPVFGHPSAIDAKLLKIGAQINVETRLLEVTAELTPVHDMALPLGTLLKSTILGGTHTGLAVPRSAVLFDDKGAYVYRLQNAKAEMIYVILGIDNGNFIEITSGIDQGDIIATEGSYQLEDGMAVRSAN